MQRPFTQKQWDEFILAYPPGTIMHGTILHSAVFGVFIRLDELPNVNALLEIIYMPNYEIEPFKPLKYPEEYPVVGSHIEVRILGWSLLPNNVLLTQLSHLGYARYKSIKQV